MNSHNWRARKTLTVCTITTFFVALAVVVFFKSGILPGEGPAHNGLSGLVSVRGAVSLEELRLTQTEIAKINQAVDTHRETFSRIILTLNVKNGVDRIERSTQLAWSLSLETTGNCEVRSWERKVQRSDLVSQMVSYMGKAAGEYKDFKRFPDIEQQFKTLYI